MKNGTWIFVGGLAVIIVLAVGASFVPWGSSGPGKYDTFAQCLKDKGVVFYGAFWCPHCQATKRMFGSSAKLLPYVECSTPDGQGQLPICKDKGIESYPTWTFANSTTTLTGEQSFEALSAASGCTLPASN